MIGRFAEWVYKTISQATGFGITRNIIDCYAALIRMWRPGDRIFLFGFSRGAYTVRCLAAVVAACGIPTHDKNGGKLKLDVAGSRKIASYAVKHIYQFTSSRKESDASARERFLLRTRELLSIRFRMDHGSFDPEFPQQANVYPYFVGVFDTVAALGSFMKSLIIGFGFLTLLTAFSFFASLVPYLPVVGPYLLFLTFPTIFFSILAVTVVGVIAAYAYTHIKFDFNVPTYSVWQNFQTLHLTEIWQQFYDFDLNSAIPYAKHAISLDENRKDFLILKEGCKVGHMALCSLCPEAIGNIPR